MKIVALPERFVLTIEGKLWNVRRRTNVVPNGLVHAVNRLLNGDEVALATFEAHGLRVTIEVDTDQADDEPDGLSVR